ncbi:MAG TPA: precorrin-8X methylmutase [Clostridiaceae bacterium]|nr:precorrin-8X methylmutase [Clostridiaceae bacterium]
MKSEWIEIKPSEIEERSFEIIASELARPLDPELAPIIMRVIHTSADFDYADNLVFTHEAITKGKKAIRDGAVIITDTNMVKAGINKRLLAELGGEALCFIADPDVSAAAKEKGTTRAVASIEKALTLDRKLIFAIGNAPTALIRLAEAIENGEIDPQLVIAVPVGFVNVEYSKEKILATDAPAIVARGRKGGSNIAAAIVNALLYECTTKREFYPGS